MTRIAYICADPGVPVFGTKGASVHIQEIVRGFRARGDSVTVYCVRRGDTPPADLGDLTVVERPIGHGDPSSRETRIAKASAALAHEAITAGCDLVYERFSLFSRASALVTRATGAPAVVEVNAPLIEEQRTHRMLLDEGAAIAAARSVLTRAALVAAVSAPVAAWARNLGADHTIVAPNGVNTDRIVPRPEVEQDSVFTVGFVGTLKPWHGVETLLHAMARLHEDPDDTSELAIIGDGPESSALRDLAARLRLNARFTGAVAPERIPEQLADLSVGVAPYPASEGEHYFSPLKVYEYLAAGLPVVASHIGQLPEAVTHDTTGLLVEPGSPEALAEALTALRDDPARRRRLGAAARADAVGRRSWATVLDRILTAIPDDPEGVSAA